MSDLVNNLVQLRARLFNAGLIMATERETMNEAIALALSQPKATPQSKPVSEPAPVPGTSIWFAGDASRESPFDPNRRGD
ncbi:hypothetical protein [Microvirga massiliensis]|uniref:hypothetical protein n=1 Tax=Microvirga massiliensis TaxID=1033741 RepID=UPI000A9C1584|nr:hypothetical protein [Microvirga massiliensis]